MRARPPRSSVRQLMGLVALCSVSLAAVRLHPAAGLLTACVGLLATFMTFEALARCRSRGIRLARWQKAGLAFSAAAVATLIVLTSAATASVLYHGAGFSLGPSLSRSPFKMAAAVVMFLTLIVISLSMKRAFWSEEYTLSLVKKPRRTARGNPARPGAE